METWAEIRRQVLVEGVSRRQMLRETGMHWRTLRKILTHSEPPRYRQSQPRARKKLGAYEGRIEQILKEDRELFESKQFLPNLRDAAEFLHRGGSPERKYKSRKEVLGPVLKRLCELPELELESLAGYAANTGDKTDYALLANQLMGKKNP